MTRPRVAARKLWSALGAVAAGSFMGWYVAVPVWLLLLIAAPMGVLLFFPGKRNIALVILVSLLGGHAMASTRAARRAALADMASAGPECTLVGTVTEVTGLGTFARVSEARCALFEPVSEPGTVAVVDDNLRLGQRITTTGNLAPLSDDPFDVARQRLGVDAIFYPGESTVGPATGLRVGPSRFRESMERAVSRLEPKSGALVLGLTIGETSGFDEQTLESFRRSGLAHLLAVSGSNVAIVIGTVALCLARLAARTRLLLCAGALAFYVAVVGPDPSVVRAALMGAIGLLGLAWGTRPLALTALALALILSLSLRPALLFSVGLHLSAAATAGLVLWSRPFARLLGYRVPAWLAWPLGATLSAQLAVAPLLILTFGELSLVAPAANLAALPAVAPATVVGLGAALAGTFSDSAGTFLAVLVSPLARWIVFCAEAFGRPSWAQVEVPTWVGWTALALAGALALRSASGSGGVH